jgi:hypothetical protein
VSGVEVGPYFFRFFILLIAWINVDQNLPSQQIPATAKHHKRYLFPELGKVPLTR